MKVHELAKLLFQLPKDVSVFQHASFDDCFTPAVFYEEKNKVAIIKSEPDDCKREHWSTDYSDPDQKKYFQVKENHLKMQTMVVIEHPDGTLEMDRDMSGRWFHHSDKNFSRTQWMKLFRPKCKLRKVYIVPGDYKE